MAHHNSTPQTVLDAPKAFADPVWITHTTTPVYMGEEFVGFQTSVGKPAFVGDVERDLLGVTVGTSRKGRKVRRATA